jgi:ribA/ribD-fused uncharacterized protein
MKAEKEIKGFFGDYIWLSNFYKCNVFYGGFLFPSVEHAYQYAKHSNPALEDYEDVLKLTSAQVKQWGKNIPLKKDWNKLKLEIMSQLVLSKFENNIDLKNKLIEIKDFYIEETNYWRDTFWGVYNSSGKNNLGKILMNTANFLHLKNIIEKNES